MTRVLIRLVAFLAGAGAGLIACTEDCRWPCIPDTATYDIVSGEPEELLGGTLEVTGEEALLSWQLDGQEQWVRFSIEGSAGCTP